MTAAETLEKIKTLFERDEAMQPVEYQVWQLRCPKCWGFVDSDDTFCRFCGQRLKKDE